MKSLPRIEVAAGILQKEGKILLAQRPEEKYEGLWEFPGGKIEHGETAENCLQRELSEELAIECVVGELLNTTEWQRPDKIIVLHTFWISSFKGEPQALEHKALKWVALNELRKDELLPADRPLVDLL